jgi:putative salt-induced outer membrane protein YdiY
MKNLLLAVLLPLAGAASAADVPAASAAAPIAVKNWKDTGELSAVSTNGNSKTQTTSLKDTFDWHREIYGLELVGGGLGSKSKGEVTAEQYNASEKGTVNVTPRNYGYERFAWDKNRFAGIQNRYDVSLGAGRELLNMPADKLIGELGLGYINEERIRQPRNDFASGRAYAKYTHVFSPTANFTQDAEYLANFDDASGYRVNTETALTTTVSTHVSLKVSYVWKRLNKPAPGIAKDDTIASAALLINY